MTDYHINIPTSAQLNMNIPKEKFYQVSDVTHKLKRYFIDEIDKITMCGIIAPRTMNITGKVYDELDIIEIKLKNRDLTPKILEVIDSAIPRPVLYKITRPNDETKYSISYKEPKGKQINKSKIVQTYETNWGSSPLKITGVSVRSIYINLIKQIDPTFDPSKPIAEAVQMTKEMDAIKTKIDKLNNQIKNEPSISKRQDLARERYGLEQQLK